jgi:AraC family L-rhamnose operon regulatory protein RhaS
LILNTIGFNYYKDYIFPVSVTDDLNALMIEDAQEYYKILHIKSGICSFNLNGKEYVIIGAHILNLNEQDRISFHEMIPARIIFFRPEIINAGFSFCTLNDPDIRLTGAELQDMFYLDSYKHNASEDKKIIPLSTIDSTGMDNITDNLNSLLTKQNTKFWPCLSRSYLYEILFSLARMEETNDNDISMANYSEHSKLAVDVIYYLQKRFREKISIKSLAEEFHTNRTTLHVEFKKHTGLSVNQYLLQLRIKIAAKLLRDTGLTLKEICERIGFNDISYFSKVFKRMLKYTPSEYRHIYH